MSYILDALKRAETESKLGNQTSLLLEQRDRRRQRLLQGGIAIALAANIVVLVWLFGPFQTPAVSTAPLHADPVALPAASVPDTGRPGPGPVPEVEAGVEPQRPAPLSAKPLPAPDPVQRADPSMKAPASTPIAARPQPRPVERTRVTVASLPATARARFPEMTFSTHIYADDPTMRAVVVNGQRLAEGDQLAGLRLMEITEEGVVFSFEDYLVTVSILESWQ